MPPSDRDLMTAVQAQDAEAFEQLVARYGETLRRHIRRMAPDEAAAGDILQETLVRVWNHAAQWKGSGALKAWLTRIAINQALNYMQAVQRRREQPLTPPREVVSYENDDDDQPYIPRWMIDPDARPDAEAEQAEQSEILRQTIETLPPEKRAVFYLAHQTDMDLRTISETLGIPEGTAKSRLHYTMKTLLERWKELNTDEETI